MRVIRGLQSIVPTGRDAVVTVGVFDGLHRGHRRVIEKIVARARSYPKALESVVVTFDPHPAKVLNHSEKAPSLISVEHRIRLLGELGLDKVVVLNFTKKFSRITPKNFVKDILISKLGAKFIYVGENFYFGKKALGGLKDLKNIAGAFGVKVYAVAPLRAGGRTISSSIVRDLIKRGEIDKAKKLLGRPVSILGTVLRGARFARVLGYPTANINPHHEVIPPAGVYAVLVKIRGMIRGGILNIGVKPTFYGPKDEEPSIEAHIFDFKSRIYGDEIEVFFVKKIRAERRFKDASSLTAQIRKDQSLTLQILNDVIKYSKRKVHKNGIGKRKKDRDNHRLQGTR